MVRDDWEYVRLGGQVTDFNEDNVRKGFYRNEREKVLYFLYPNDGGGDAEFLTRDEFEKVRPVIVAGSSVCDDAVYSHSLIPVSEQELKMDHQRWVGFVANGMAELDRGANSQKP